MVLVIHVVPNSQICQAIFQRIDEDGSGQVTFEELVEGARKDKEFQSRQGRDHQVFSVSEAMGSHHPKFT